LFNLPVLNRIDINQVNEDYLRKEMIKFT